MAIDKFVLVVGSGPQVYRETMFRSLSQFPVWLLSNQEPSWEIPYIADCTVLPRLSAAQISTRLDFIESVVLELAGRLPIGGVLTFEELYTPVVCRIADFLGVPSFGAGAVENCRDKQRTRTLLRMAGLPQPQSEFATDAAEAGRMAREIGFPVVIKPRGLAGSIGVVSASTPNELGSAVDAALTVVGGGAQRHAGGVLVETFIAGPEISVDSAIVDGVLTPLFIAHKRFGPAPYFEEFGQLVNGSDPLLTDDALLKTLRQAHDALGVRNGVTHTEMRLAGAGPVIIEVNARPGGALVPHTVGFAMGIEPALIAAQVATGAFTPVSPIRRLVAASELIPAPAPGTVADVVLPELALHPNVVAAAPIVRPGERVDVPPAAYRDRCAYVISVGDDITSCAKSLAAAVREVVVILE